MFVNLFAMNFARITPNYLIQLFFIHIIFLIHHQDVSLKR